jgi:hypothetical protein
VTQAATRPVNGQTFRPDGSADVLLRAERLVLGYALDPQRASHVVEDIEGLEPKHFMLPAHEHVFGAVKREAGHLDVQMRVLTSLVENPPKALDALDESLPGFITSCVKEAEFFDAATLLYYANQVRGAFAKRQGQALLAKVSEAFVSENDEALELALLAFAEVVGGRTEAAAGPYRNVDLTAFLNGTYKPLKPSVGGLRDDGQSLLYAGLWHTLIAPTTSGKSWFALWHCIQEMRNGSTVAYAHFEETSPAGTLGRIRQMAPDLTSMQILTQFRWLDCTVRWTPGEFRRAIPPEATLVILDGINACCGQHGWVVDKPEAVGAYRSTFVTPAASIGAAVLSLGHPVKNTERQNERHGYGATGWLDEVNGAAFRLVPSKRTPIGKGMLGHSALYTVKDREGEVQVHGLLDSSEKRENWWRIGSFKVDDRPEAHNTSAWLNIPTEDEDAVDGADPVDKLGESILTVLEQAGGSFQGINKLQDMLTAAGVSYNKTNVKPAVERLSHAGRLQVTTQANNRREGVLVPLAPVSEIAGHPALLEAS